ncbi:MAG: sigma-70 family RNA polymerase sigma factor [Polyangiales bacterium]
MRIVREAEATAPFAPPPPAPPSSSRSRPSLLDDAELLAALQNGDSDAANAMYDRMRPKVESTIRRLLGAGDVDHQDCVQTTFVEIVRSIDRYRGECPIEHWAAQIAANVVYKHIRRRRLERRFFGGTVRPSERPEPVSSSRRMVAKDLVERVRDKLALLEPQKAFTFMLHDVLGFDLQEIAGITGVSVAAAQKRLVRGRRDVHTELARDAELAGLVEDLGDAQ